MYALGKLHFPELRASLDALDAIATHHEFRELTQHLRKRIPESLKRAVDTLHDSIAYLRELLVTDVEASRTYAGAPNDKTLEDVMWARAAVEGALDEVLTDLGRAEAQLRAFQTTLHGGQESLIARMAMQVSQAIARITADWVSANEIEIGSVHESFTR
jgi:hypothetical protein